MDPNVSLILIRSLVAQAYNDTASTDEHIHLAEAVDELDNWLSNGGFLPHAWQNDTDYDKGHR